MNKGRLLDFLGVVFPLMVFLSLSLYQITLPGLYYDEALDAVPAMQLLLGQKIEMVREAGVQLGGQKLPLMVMDYVGAVHTYALLPFFALFGVNVLSIRLMTIVGGAVVIVLSYFLAKALFGFGVALTSSLLLATHPSFVFYSRQGIHVSSLMVVFAMGSLLALLRWHRSGESPYFYTGAVLLGLGLSTKILFVWFIIALGLIYLWQRWAIYVFRPVLKLDRSRAPALSIREPRGYEWLLGGLAFALGSGMLLRYNIATQGTLKVLAQNLFTSQYGINNLDFAANFAVRLGTFSAILDGGHFWFLGGLFSNQWYPPLFAVLSISGLALPPSPYHQGSCRKGVALLLALLALILVQSSFTVSGLWPTHLYILLPIINIIMAVGLFALFRFRPSLFNWTMGMAVFLVLFVGNIGVDFQYHMALDATGGRRSHSDAIYRLADYLDKEDEREPLAMDWGIKTSVQIMTQGRVNPDEIFQYSPEPNDTFYHWLYGALTNGRNPFIFHAEDSTVFPRFEAFGKMAHDQGKEIVLEQVISERDGTPVFMVYKAQ